VKTELWPLERLIDYARNPRKNDHAVDRVAAAIKEFGFRVPIVAKSDGLVVDGHLRLKAARKLGLAEVPVVLADDLTDAQVKAFRISVNRMAELAEWDSELLALELGELGELGFDLDLTGFSDEELDGLTPTEEPAALTDPDETPETPAVPRSVLGDVWLCGKHRVMCGDSTSVDAVGALMAGGCADLCFTSPPYALGKSAALSGNKKISQRGAAYDEHEDDADSWSSLMAGWWAASLPFVSAWVVNVQPLAGNKRELFRWINDRVDRLVDVATWDKGHAAPQMASGVMSSRYEWIIIFGDDGASRVVPFSSWHGTVQSVYDAPPQRKNEFADVHGATMPSHLAEWACGTLCDKAKTVFDPFGGTGTTMIACEKLGKVANLMEISPAYVDVIVKRWQDYTGKKATREADGVAFDEVG
jgi:DNA modification methylase